MSSNIPRAREIIQAVLKLGNLGIVERRHLHDALKLMTRDSPIRRAPRKRCRITSNTRRKIHNLSLTDMTMFEIANSTGVNNQARVSEVLNGKR